MTLIGLLLLSFVFSMGILKISERICTFEGIPYEFTRNEFLFTGALGMLLSRILYLNAMNLPSEDAIWFILPFIWFFSVQWMIDMKYQELADEWNILLGIMSVGYSYLYMHESFSYNLWSISIVTFFCFMIWFLLGGIGLGDVKYLFATSILYPVWKIPQFIMIAFGLGLIGGTFNMIVNGTFGKKESLKTEIAFGPYLIVATFCMFFI